MICPSCRNENADHLMFCMGCGGRLRKVPAAEPGAAAMGPIGPTPTAGTRCAACGGGRTVQGGVGPALGVRVYAVGRQVDLPIAAATVCVDCGHVGFALADDARRYLAGMLGA
jgi:hypothetical protein